MKIIRIKFKRFNKPHILKKIGRDLLARFFERFKTELEAMGSRFRRRNFRSRILRRGQPFAPVAREPARFVE